MFVGMVDKISPDLYKFYNSNLSLYFNKIPVPYLSELTNIIWKKSLIYLKSKEDKYDPSKSSSLAFFYAILKSYVMVESKQIEILFDPTKHDNYIEKWDPILRMARRNHNLKIILDEIQ